MSDFSDLLSLFIKTRDVNVSALTSYCNLDRSTMYKLINGKRTPTSKTLVRHISAFMNLNPVETQELMDAYFLTKAGWDTYYRRKNVLEFIMDFTNIHKEVSFSSYPDFTDFSLFTQSSDTKIVPLSGQLQLSSAVHQILIEEASRPDGKIYILAQPEHLESLNISMSLLNCREGVAIQHLLCINNSKSLIRSQQNYNIQCLKRLIPFYSLPLNYQPYYYYDNVNSHFNNLNFMPCLFLTSNAAVTCSSDIKEGILFREDGSLKLFRKRFCGLLKNAEPLTLKFASTMSFHLNNFSSIYSESANIYGLSAEPCLTPYFSSDLLEKYLLKELPQRSLLIQKIQEYIQCLNDSNLRSYFTRDGVMNFLLHGKLHEIPDTIYTSLEQSDRIKLLKRLCTQIENGKDIRLLKGPLDKFPLTLHLSVTPNYGYLMFSEWSGELSYIFLKEQNILTSFYDFCCSLEENEMLDSKEETLNFLHTLIE